MDRDTAIDKIRKCLALGKSAEPAEAAAAMRQAQKLMALHGLTAADMQLADVHQMAADVPAGALVAWQANLANLLSDAFGCGHIWSKASWLQYGRVKVRRQVIFYGHQAAAEVACYTWDVLFRQCNAARAAHVAKQPKNCKAITKTARGDRFAMGWVLGVMRLVERFAGNTEQHQQLLEAYAGKAWPDSTSVKPLRKDVGRNVRDHDYLDGVQAGRGADLRRGVAGAAQAPLLGSGS